MCPRFSSGLGFGASRARPTSPDFAGNQSLGSDVGRRTLRKGAQYRQHARQPQGHVGCRSGRGRPALRLPARINDLCQPPTHHICSSAGFAGMRHPGKSLKRVNHEGATAEKPETGAAAPPARAGPSRPMPAHAGGHEPATVELEARPTAASSTPHLVGRGPAGLVAAQPCPQRCEEIRVQGALSSLHCHRLRRHRLDRRARAFRRPAS